MASAVDVEAFGRWHVRFCYGADRDLLDGTLAGQLVGEASTFELVRW